MGVTNERQYADRMPEMWTDSTNRLQINTETMEVLFNGASVKGLLGLDVHLEPDNCYVIFKCCL